MLLVAGRFDCQELLWRIHEGNRSTAGLKFVTKCYGIIGFMKFLGPYYMFAITRRRKVGTICGHDIYSIGKSEVIAIVVVVLSVVGILQDEVDPMVSVMRIEMAPLESCADIGGLDAQIQEIKEAVELPELYEDIGFRHPNGVILYGEQGKLYLQSTTFSTGSPSLTRSMAKPSRYAWND